MGEPAPPLKQIHALRAAAASGREDVLRGALADMSPTLARVGVRPPPPFSHHPPPGVGLRLKGSFGVKLKP